jgi:hypothetical protein
VVIDTTARVVRGSENDADTFRDFYRHTGLPLKSADVTWARADHLGKDADRGARGSSAKNDDIDIAWQLARTGPKVTLKATKRRVRWCSEAVELTVLEEPNLHHDLAPREWHPGAHDAARKLEEAGVPVDASRSVARELLKKAGVSVGTDALRDGLRMRREQSP